MQKSFALQPKGQSSVSIESLPTGADVYLDNVLIGKSPIDIGSISPGMHSFRFAKAGYSDMTKQVEIFAGLKAYVSASLTPITDTVGPASLLSALAVGVTSAPISSPVANLAYDMNSDGFITYLDVKALVDMINSASACPSGKVCDFNGDKMVDAADVSYLAEVIR